MPLSKKDAFGNQQVPPQQNQGFQPPFASEHFGGGNYSPRLGRGLQRFLPLNGGLGGLPMPPGLGRIMKGLGGGLGGGMFGPQGMSGEQPVPPAQSYPYQGYAPQKPVQPAWEAPPKSGIKGFLNNLMAKLKR